MIPCRQEARFAVVRIVTWSVLSLAVGCGGDGTNSGVNQATPKTTPVDPLLEGDAALASRRVDPPTPLNAADTSPAIESSQTQAARVAFRVLITPGSEPAAWDAAQQQLVTLGVDAIPALIDGLKSTNPIERETAATVCALTNAVDSRLQLILVECLSDSSSFVRANAAAALAQIPEHQPTVMATLTSLLTDSDPQLRRMAAANLGSFGAEASVELPKLTAVLDDSDAEVVTPVIQLLGRIGPPAVEAVPQLQKIAFEHEGEIKQAAEQALLLIQSEPDANATQDK